MPQFIVLLMGGSPCDTGPGQQPKIRMKPGRALTEFFERVWKKAIPVFDIAASKDRDIDDDDLGRLLKAIVDSDIDQVMIPISVHSLIRVAEFLLENWEALANKKIVLWSTPKHFSNNKKLGPIAIGMAIGAFALMKPGICAAFRDDLFDPFQSVYNEQEHRFVAKQTTDKEAQAHEESV
jgi:hypothetical protein